MKVFSALTVIDSINCPSCKEWTQKLCANIQRQKLPGKAAKSAHGERHRCIHVSPWKDNKAVQCLPHDGDLWSLCGKVVTVAPLFYLKLSRQRDTPLQHPVQNPGWCWCSVQTHPFLSRPGPRNPGQTPGHREKHSRARPPLKRETN